MAIDDPKTRMRPPAPKEDEVPTPALSIEERMLALQERQLAIQEAQAQAQLAAVEVQKEQVKQTRRKSNAVAPGISAFNPRGQKDYPMPELKCEIYAPWKMTPTLHSLDREEVELFNLLEPGDFTVELNDGARAEVCVVGVRNHVSKRLEKLSLMGPKDPDTNMHTGLFTNENKTQWPSLKKMLREMLDQQGTEIDVMTIAKERQLVASGQLAVSVGE
jgi:hypothetical protein